jgi:hypothetical protein
LADSHWGSQSLKVPLLVVIAAVALMLGMIALFSWSPWERPSEVEWLQDYEAWSERTEAMLGDIALVQASCESAYDEEVGGPPTQRLEPAAHAARRGCAGLSPEGWQRAQSEVGRAIRDVHAAEAPPRQSRDFSELARSIAGREATVYCWSAVGWAQLFEHYALLRGDDEISLRGMTDIAEGRIDLDPGICATLRGYVRRYRPPALSDENFELARALVVLAHEAELLRSPSASEVEAECYAVQHVRPFMASWDSDYQTEIALQAWELHYTQLPRPARTPECRNSGPLDLHPGSDAWP